MITSVLVVSALVASLTMVTVVEETANAAIATTLGYAVQINDAVYDQTRGLVYASVPGSDADHPNSVVAFRPADGAVEWSVPAGNEPGRIALSDDASALYVSIDGDLGVARIQLATTALDLTFGLGDDPHSTGGVMHVGDMAVLPGQPGVLAVVLRYQAGDIGDTAGVAVFDGGARRPNVALSVDSVIEAVSGTTLYGYGGGAITTLEVDANGVTQTNSVPTTVWEDVDIAYEDGRLYTSNGAVINPSNGSILGRFPVPGTNPDFADLFIRVRPVVEGGRAYLIKRENEQIGNTPDFTTNFRLATYDATSFDLVDDVRLVVDGSAQVVGMISTPHGLLIWTTDGFAHALARMDGQVTDAITNAPIHTVCVFADNGDEYFETRTDNAGRYELELMADAYWVVFADCEYYDYFWEVHDNQPIFDWRDATLVNLTPGSSVTINAALSPLFVDVVPTSTFFLDIIWLRNAGVTTGTSPTTYSPGDFVTREQMASFLARTVRFLGMSCAAGVAPFVDVPASSFALNDIACIHQLGVTTGTSPTTYSPGDSVTREQMAAFLARTWRALGNKCPAGPAPFVDVPASSFAVNDIACIYQLGVTTGTSPTTYSPGDFVTREQMAAFIARLGRQEAPWTA
jgi:hypothetical protein